MSAQVLGVRVARAGLGRAELCQDLSATTFHRD